MERQAFSEVQRKWAKIYAKHQLTITYIEVLENALLTAITGEMNELYTHISPESLSAYFEVKYKLFFSPAEAKEWLEKQDWYKV